MQASSSYGSARQLESYIMRALSDIDLSSLALRQRELAGHLKMQVIDLRLEARDYEYAETRRDQQTHRAAVLSYLEPLRQAILSASEYGIFSAIDVVEFSTLLDNLKEALD